MNKLDSSKFKSLLGDWFPYLEKLIETEEMYNLYQEFKQCKEIITPTSNDIFNAFKYCPQKDLKLIIIGQDPYPSRYFNTKTLQADGLAFSCSNSPNDKIQPSLTSFWDGLSHEFQQELPYEKDLKFIAEQGVLLLNRALNCKLGKIGSFMGKWDFFYQFLFEEIINKYYKGVPIIFVGKDAEYLKRYIFELNNPVFTLTHPSFAARNNTLWETNNVFTKCNRLIEEQFGKNSGIIWNKTIWNDIDDLPF